LPETGKSYLQRVIQSAAQMDRLLTDLLEYSKLAQAEIVLQPVEIEAAVQQALTFLEPEIQAKSARVLVDANDKVIAHPATLTLILLNFVSNSLKFVIPNKPPEIHVTAAPAGDYVRVSVTDNGIGIDENGKRKLFQVFQRLHAKQAYPGTGLGLAIVRKGAERMGGRVGVESELGKGSCFWVELRKPSPVEDLTPSI